MTHRTTIALENVYSAFLYNIASDNRNIYINELLKQERKNHIKQVLNFLRPKNNYSLHTNRQ